MDAVPAPTPAPPAAEETYPAGWFRLDHDNLGLQLWVGATHDVGFNLATDIYVTAVPFTAEFDIGPAFTIGDLTLTPMAGITFDWTQQKAVTLVAPQLFTIYNGDPIYFESWIQGFFSSIFTEDALNYLYTRNFLLFKFSDWVALGPHMDLQYNLKTDTTDATLASLWVGGALMLNYGKDNTLLLALGYETQEDARTKVVDEGDPTAMPPIPPTTEEHALRGRFTFIKTW